uniref:Zinc finger protein 653 n=1 Tax=Cyclopterus lumpus TaxID=8103 RepID=A0A8C3GAI1_CYCLU
MAHSLAELDVPLDADHARDQEKGGLRRCRGRPRLTDSDRAQRRLESRKKYDVRRVYLGESHKLWSELRRRTSLSDAGLAEYLVVLNTTYGEKYQQKKERVSSLQSLVCWYQEHSRSCPHEPQLGALQPRPNASTAAVWRCDSDHSFVQYLFSPQREASDSEHEEGVTGEGDDDDESEEGEEDLEEPEDLQQGRDGDGEGEVGAAAPGYECVTLAASLADRLGKADEDSVLSQSLSSSAGLGAQPESPITPPMQVEEQSELFDPHTLQTVVTSCEIPDQRTNLEGSQLIIITGPSYEALASEGIQLNMGGTNVEEVTCTVIGGVTYKQVSESKLRAAEDEDSMTGALHSEMAQNFLLDGGLLMHSDPEEDPGIPQNELANVAVERGNCVSLLGLLPPVRSKRNRRGPVIEADGMLKMFHCPYEGCSQVYVAISSFQNHVNLVHRKGRTKVCPHPGCGKKFYLSNHLHRHMIIHSGVRDFICETCGKSFKRKNHLEVHRRTHTGETPLQCEICGYQCRQRASLNWHMKKHTSEAHYNFTCEFCEKRFEKLDSVKFHKLKSHPDKQAP